jgi:hypothetical protein
MTWARSSGVRSKVTKIAVAGMLLGISAAAVSVPAFAATVRGGAPSVLTAPLPADPPTNAPAPPPQPPPPSQSNYTDDWWGYGTDASGGGGGGGG